MRTAEIHTDGACANNPGPGGFGAIVIIDGTEYTITGGDPKTTNNRMELSAVIEAVDLVNQLQDPGPWNIIVHSDSKYVVDAFNRSWIRKWQGNGWRNASKQPVANQELWQRLLQATTKHRMTFRWVKGHSGDPMNERCDELATAEAAFASNADGYWVTAGNPRSTVYDESVSPGFCPNTPEPAAVPSESERPGVPHATYIVEAMITALEECETFECFSARMNQVLADVAQ